MVGKKKATEVLMYVESMGVDAAKEHFGVTHDTISRYVRKAKQLIVSESKVSTNTPKVLIFDLETTPLKGFFWGLWKQNIDAIKMLEQESHIICYSAKWLGQADMMHDSCTTDEMVVKDDSRVCNSLWSLLDEADVCIAHNLIKFDRKKANTRFLKNGMMPPSPYKLIDTLVKVKQEFAFPSNRLDFINKSLGLERKRDTGGFELWEDCMKGNQEALDKMQFYCDGDIIALEEAYFVLAPWFRGNINFGVFNNVEKEMCSHCGSEDIYLTDSHYTTNVSRFPIFRCKKCGGMSRARYSELTLKKRKNLLTSIGG